MDTKEESRLCLVKKINDRTPSVRYESTPVVSHRPDCTYPTDCRSTRTLVRPHLHIYPHVPSILSEHRKAPAAIAVTGLLAALLRAQHSLGPSLYFPHCIHSGHDQSPHIHHMNMDVPSPTPRPPPRSVSPPTPAPLAGLLDRPAPSWFSSRCSLGVRSSLCYHADTNSQEKSAPKTEHNRSKAPKVTEVEVSSFFFPFKQGPLPVTW